MKTSFGAMTGRERLCFVLKYLFMALCVVVALFPIIWVILSSFKTNAEILSNASLVVFFVDAHRLVDERHANDTRDDNANADRIRVAVVVFVLVHAVQHERQVHGS